MDNQTIAVINAGSSSLKFSIFKTRGNQPEPWIWGQIEHIHTGPLFSAHGVEGVLDRDISLGDSQRGHHACLAYLLAWLAQRVTVTVAGHRVVHGGTRFFNPVRIDAAVLAELATLVPLAPLHQPHNIAGIKALEQLHPGLPQVACFDTAFHSTKRAEATLFPIPRELTEAGVRRYGFHGLSYEYVARALLHVAPDIARGRVVVAHLGNGVSMCALAGGKSVDSSMGFTAADGLPMGTRSGSLDPGVLLYLAREKGMSLADIEDLIYNRSGLKGVSGMSHDMRLLLQSQHSHAAEAVDLFVYRILQQLGALTASLGGLDGLVFTAGIGEHSPVIRERVVRGAAWLGLELDAVANEHHGPRITTPNSKISAWVIPTHEEFMIALHTQALMAAA